MRHSNCILSAIMIALWMNVSVTAAPPNVLIILLVKDFGRMKLGTISLSPGIISLSIKAKTIAAENVMDLRMLILKRRTPSET